MESTKELYGTPMTTETMFCKSLVWDYKEETKMFDI